MTVQELRDWERISAAVGESWKRNRDSPLEYTPKFIDSLASYPGGLPVISPALFDGDQLAAFVLGFPRTFTLNRSVRKLLLMTLFTVAPAYQGRGLGRKIWAECVLQAFHAGYEGTLHYCVQGNISNAVTAAGASLAGFVSQHVLTIPYLMRMLRSHNENLRGDADPDLGTFLKYASLVPDIAVRRQWTEAEAIWQFNRPGAIAVTNPEIGALTGFVMNVADAQRTSVCFLEDILWQSDEGQRTALLSEFLLQAAARCSLAVAPVLGYADLQPLKDSGFRKSPRVLNAYLTPFMSLEASGVNQAIYADVL